MNQQLIHIDGGLHINQMIYKQIKIELFEYNYWEHYKFAKDLALILPLNHPKRKLLEEELSKMMKELNELKNK